MGRVVLHLDANSFYASVELAYAPHLRGLPLSVGGDADMRHGIILASSTEAKKMGVKTGMPLFQAKQFCPKLIVIKPEFDKYKRFSDRLRGMMMEYTPLVESYGLDEAWMEITNPGITLGDGCDLAALLRRRAREELGITLSAGVSYNKIFAKLGSDYKKPDATTVISKANYKEIVWPLPSSDLLFVGPKSFRRLKDLNILTIGDIANSPPGMLESCLGKLGAAHVAHANGLDNTPVMPITTTRDILSVGNSMTTPADMVSVDDVKCVFGQLAESVAMRLREAGMVGRCVSIHVRDTALRVRGCQLTIDHCTSLAGDITGTAMRLFAERDYARMLPLRSIGVSVSSLADAGKPLQLDLFGDAARRDRQLRLDETVDVIKGRFGSKAVIRGNVLAHPLFSVLDPYTNNTIHPVPFYAGQ